MSRIFCIFLLLGVSRLQVQTKGGKGKFWARCFTPSWYYMSKRTKGPIYAICISHPYAAFPFYFLNQFCPFWLQSNINAFSSNVQFCIIWILSRYTSETYIPGEATLPEQMQQNYLTCKGQNGWSILILIMVYGNRFKNTSKEIYFQGWMILTTSTHGMPRELLQ